MCIRDSPTADLIRARDLDPGGSWTDRAGVTHTHILGTDSVGRDYLTRLMEGGRVSLSLAIIVIMTSMIIGMLIGATAGYFGGWVDAVIMRVVDFILTLPDLPVIMVLSVILADYIQDIPGGSVTILGIIFVGFGWVGAARLVRGLSLIHIFQDEAGPQVAGRHARHRRRLRLRPEAHL